MSLTHFFDNNGVWRRAPNTMLMRYFLSITVILKNADVCVSERDCFALHCAASAYVCIQCIHIARTIRVKIRNKEEEEGRIFNLPEQCCERWRWIVKNQRKPKDNWLFRYAVCAAWCIPAYTETRGESRNMGAASDTAIHIYTLCFV